MEHKELSVTSHLVKITKETPFGSLGSKKEIWYWEIQIADEEVKGEQVDSYYGSAVERSKAKQIPWTEMKSFQPLDEMIKMCKCQMK